MGEIISRFRNEETEDVLDRLEADIKEMERDKQRQHHNHERYAKRCMILFVIFCVIYLTYVIYVWVTIQNLKGSLILLMFVPLFVLLIIYKVIRAAISFYYSWGLEEKKNKLNELRKEKRKKLEEVKNTAVYTKAKMILDKYDIPDEELNPLISDNYEYDD